jgi:hypothetical protein
MLYIRPPDRIRRTPGTYTVFLAGSIEQGSAENWQEEVENNMAGYPITIWNPRRSDWDPSMKDIRPQVEWELNALNKADLIAMYFDPNTKSPIALLEFGLYAKSNKLIVCCPEGFYRKQNVDTVCEQYKVAVLKDLDSLIGRIRMFSSEGVS